MAEVPKFISITYEGIKSEIENFLRNTYAKADQLFTPASPYGHILTVMEELFQLSILYLKNSIRQNDMSDPDALSTKQIRSNALLAGHVATRDISATGTLRFRLNSTTDLDTDIPGRKITIFNKTQLRNDTNGRDYIIDLGGSDSQTFNISTGEFQFFMNIIQGRYETSTFTGTGEINQSFSLEIPGADEIENFNVSVSVNGDEWSIKKHLYEILPNEQACVVRTGFNGGIDIIFGNGGFGDIPPIGSIIEVEYIVTEGSNGNIFRRTVNDWKIVDDVLDGFGNTIDLTQFFDIFIYTDINFGTDGETPQFTKNILPLSSNNFVLALPQQYAYEIKKLGVFSHVNAYEKNDVIHIVCTPNINLFKRRNADYFTVPLEAFTLDDYEKFKIDNYLKINGNIQLTRKYRIDSPTLSFYVMNVIIVTYEDVIDDNVNEQIYDKISEYFLNFNRLDRVPIKDIINRISEIEGIDSVDIQFMSKKNEDYHREFILKDRNRRQAGVAADQDLSIEKAFPDYNPNEVRGLDPVLGDIIFEPSEIPVIRGGWKDRNGVFYSDRLGKGLGSVNIIKRGTTDRRNIINT